LHDRCEKSSYALVSGINNNKLYDYCATARVQSGGGSAHGRGIGSGLSQFVGERRERSLLQLVFGER